MELTITDATGKAVLNKAINVLEGINLFPIYSDFNPGVYFINISGGNNQSIVIKHIVK